MLLCLDVHYGDRGATATCVGFAKWTDAESVFEFVVRSSATVEPYEPGQFYKRELPHLLAALDRVPRGTDVAAVVVDAHVWLAPGKPGLGAHLYEALERSVPVVGVAKSEFHGSHAIPVVRGSSRHPLFVTAAGMDPKRAARLVREMHGPYRLPTLLKRADSLARGEE